MRIEDWKKQAIGSLYYETFGPPARGFATFGFVALVFLDLILLPFPPL